MEELLQSLHNDPNEEMTWLALADWLEENGQAERAALARLFFRPYVSSDRRPRPLRCARLDTV